jgi:hypothetical protein
MKNVLDYYTNPDILTYMKKAMFRIKNSEDREDCHQEIFAELYDFMPLDTEGAQSIIKRVAMKFERSNQRLYDHEISYAEAGIQ